MAKRRNLVVELLESRELPATIIVGDLSDKAIPLPGDTTLTLREAIELSNGSLFYSALTASQQAAVSYWPPGGAPNLINFAVGGTISPGTALPRITAPLIINGVNIRIDGTLAAPAPGQTTVDGLAIAASNCVVNSLNITGFSGSGVSISGLGSHGNWLWGNTIGTLPNPANSYDYAITASLRNGVGVNVTASNNTIGGNDSGQRNVIDNNGVGLILNTISDPTNPGTGTIVEGNFILDNLAQGVLVTSSNNTIGQYTPGGGNFISGNQLEGIKLLGGTIDPVSLLLIPVQGNGIFGNEIGPDVAFDTFYHAFGTRPRTFAYQQQTGILVQDSPRNNIGARSPGAASTTGNVIAGNALDGIDLLGTSSTGNRVLNNTIGFNPIFSANPPYTTALPNLTYMPNANGIKVTGPANVIGGTDTGSSNTISNNRLNGILLSGAGATGNLVEGNIIGLLVSPNGDIGIGNGFDGVKIDGGSGNFIGGSSAVAANTISTNNNGVEIMNGGTANVVLGNNIGTDSKGIVDLGNAVDGVFINNASNNVIGGTVSGAGNVISGNNRGVEISHVGSTGNLVQGNFIGTDRGGTLFLHNEVDGVLVFAGASKNTIGGLVPGAGNTIANNIGSGVNLDSGTGNSVLSNSFFNNLGSPAVRLAGINLNLINHANGLLHAPVLSTVTPNATTTNVMGRLSATPGNTYTIQFFLNPGQLVVGSEQGQTLLSTISVTTDAVTGVAVISQVIAVSVPAGEYVTATATDAAGNTSAFSNAWQAVPIAPQFASAGYTASESGVSAVFTVNRNGPLGTAFTVDYSVGGGTATAGTDYSAVSNTLSFGPSDLSETFSVPILDAKKVVGSVTLNVTLGNPTGGAMLGAQASTVLTILDDDVPSFRINSGLAAVNESAGSLTLTVTRNSSLGTATVDYATAAGTALAGVNYTTTAGTLTFGAGVLSETVTVPILDDHVVRGPLKFTLVLSNPSAGNVLGATTATTITVVNTDTPGGSTPHQSLTFLVNTATDENNPTDGTMSLREAILISDGVIALSALSPTERALVIVSPSPTLPPGTPAIPNTIDFNIPGSGIQTIEVDPGQNGGLGLPAITAPLIINGYSQPGSAVSAPDKTEVILNDARVRIDGSLLGAPLSGAGYDGLAIQTSNCEINGLIITGFSGSGISISNAGSQGNWIWGDFLGALPDPTFGRNFEVSPAGMAAAFQPMIGNLGAGITITSSNNRVGGDSPGSQNVIANNGYDEAGNLTSMGVGLLISSPGGTGNLIQGNAIFNNAAQGILVESSNNTIGEAHAGGGNSIGGNGGAGVEILSPSMTGSPLVQGNQLLGNFIGTNLGTPDAKQVKGTIGFPNFGEGLLIQDSAKNTIGGYTDASRNVIGSNLLDGVAINGLNATGNRILHNFIGFDEAGAAIYFLPNQNGVAISAGGNFVGDGSTGGGNTIANNRNHGILLTGAGATGNAIEGNVIGLNPGGGSAFPNAFDGIHLDNAPNNVIGGTTATTRNVISSNNNGVYLSGAGSTGNLVEGNFIGTGIDGLTDLGNAVDGVVLDNAPLNTIGGVTATAGNVISGNNRGVRVTGSNAHDNKVEGNFIGTDDMTQTAVIHNEIDGVLITNGASNNLIGVESVANPDGSFDGASNFILNNGGAGVNLDDGTANRVLGNSIYGNVGHGITSSIGAGIVLNLGNNANRKQLAPTITAVAATGGTTNVQGTLGGLGGATYRIQFFSSPAADPSGFGQGATLLDTKSVTTNALGVAVLDLDLSGAVASGQWVTATATDALGDTSGFSNAMLAVPVAFQFDAGSYSANEGDGSATITVVRNGGQGGAASVDYSVGGGTAVAGTDYVPINGTLYFNAGDPTTKTFAIALPDPHRVGGSLNTQVTLKNAKGGASISGTNPVVLTIQDNEVAAIQFLPNPPTTPYTFYGAGPAWFVLGRNTGSGTASVHYATSDGSARAGVNYLPASGTITFNPGETSKAFTVPVLDDYQPHPGPLTFQLTLSGASGAILGAASTITAKDYTNQGSGTFKVGVTSVVVGPGGTMAVVLVDRLGGKTGAVSVYYSANGGSAGAGVDYQGVSGTLTFGPGESSKSITIPVFNTTTPGPDLTFNLTLASPGGGASLGLPAVTVVTIQHGTPVNPNDHTPPIVTDVQLLAGVGGVTEVVVTFSKPMNPTRATNPANFGAYLTTPGPDGVYGSYDDGSVAIVRVGYDPTWNHSVLFLATPLPFGVFGQMVLDRDATTAPGKGLADVSGNLLDGTGSGWYPGSPYTVTLAEGRQLAYQDRSGDLVSLKLSGPGLMAIRRGADGEAQQVRLAGTYGSVLTGTVTRPKRGVGGTTTIGSIVGTAGARIGLRTPPFYLGGISSAAVDSLAVSGGLKTKKRGQSNRLN